VVEHTRSVGMRELSLHILDVVQNSLAAGASRIELTIDQDCAADQLTIIVRDNGRGMDRAQLEMVTDPFFTTRTTRRVGLGIPLLKAAAERCNGRLVIESAPGQGTTLQAVFQDSHIDRAPLGNLASTLLTIILGDTCDLHYVHRSDGSEFSFDTAEIRAALGDIPLTHPAARRWLREFLVEGERGVG